MKILIGLCIAAVVVVGGFFLLNSYIYQEKQGPAAEAPAEHSAQEGLVAYISDRPDVTKPKEDWVGIAFDGEGTLSLDGWTVRSAVSGKEFPIDRLNGVPIVILAGDEGVFVHTAIDRESYRLEAETHLYYHEPSVAWQAHDTIELVNAAGVVVDSYSY